METLLRAALLDWLRSDLTLADLLNAVEEESPVRATPPWLGIATSASIDWSAKNRIGREVRIALELQTRGDDAVGDGALVAAIEKRMTAFPRNQSGFDMITVQFLRARAERRPQNLLTILLEYRFRILETSPE
ncbi:hypothetical protein GCM10023115_02560 [Pontixanthobacter gangjinensis]|uniref:DUF3168 domain-containing protein n=1 Tax=Pontixanthobacter gangjinensis TaxID=1028742 RepID=A0A6I4SIJ8_9SPHN|nr:DUF3168 domain-containing protein [Pontixanthobacter gangjinensis]MXO55509.1 DUF3168 domain-containing protein [Pontixanthobacter gangjinensis]